MNLLEDEMPQITERELDCPAPAGSKSLKLMKCKFDKNRDHDWTEISRTSGACDSESVIKWCRNCGSLETYTIKWTIAT